MNEVEAQAMLGDARRQLRSGSPLLARECFQQILQHLPDCLEAQEGWATAAFLGGDPQAARIAFERLTTLHPQEARHWANLGAVLNKVQDFPAAIKSLQKAIQKDKRTAQAYFNLGYAYRKLQQAPLAISAFREAVRLDPKMGAAYLQLGQLYADQENHSFAVKNFKKSLEIQPDCKKTLAGLQQSESALEKLKTLASPFGRLVSGDTQFPLVTPQIERPLSDSERVNDRQKLQGFAEELEQLSVECQHFLRTRLEPRLLALQRITAAGADSQQAFFRAADEFHQTLGDWRQLRKRFRRKCLELRAHEELIATPIVQLSKIDLSRDADH